MESNTGKAWEKVIHHFTKAEKRVYLTLNY